MPLYVNCVVLRQKDSRWIISSTGKEVLCPREASSLSLSSATLTARSTGILVKSETTSKDAYSSQASRVLSLMKSANCYVLPSSLRFRPPLRSAKGYKLIVRTGFSFLKLRIDECHSPILRLRALFSSSLSELSALINNSETSFPPFETFVNKLIKYE